MTDREKVIQHFEDCIKIADCQINHHWVFVRTEMMRDALALLKAQEPRVMTWDEVFCENRPFVVWIETRHGDTTEPLAFVDGEYVNTDCTLFVELNFENQGDYMADNDNGFRFWTAQPTLEEMEEASWD